MGANRYRAPQVGFIQEQLGSFRQISGLAGNFIMGAPAASSVISATFSGLFGIIKTNPEILVTDAVGHLVTSASAPSGPALFAFSANGQPALVYLINSHALLQWNGSAFVLIPLDSAAIAADTLWSIAAPDPDHAAFLVERHDGLWNVRVLLATGEMDSQTALPGLKTPALMLASGDIVSTETQGLVISASDGSEVHLAAQLPRGFSLQQIGDGWLQLRDLSQHRDVAVRVLKNHEGLYTLPEVSQ